MRRDALRGLYAITPQLRETAALVELARAALLGGAALLQYRFKDVEPGLAREQAAALRRLTRELGVPLIVNDDLELALAVGADGVHLGRDDASAADARRRWPGGILGVSC